MIIEIITVAASVTAAIFAVLSWHNQTHVRVEVDPGLMILNNNPVVSSFIKSHKISISNVGNVPVSIIDVILCVEKVQFSLKSVLSQQDTINIHLPPGKVDYFFVNMEMIIDFISNGSFRKESPIFWKIKTSNGKVYTIKTKNIVNDVVDCKKEHY